MNSKVYDFFNGKRLLITGGNGYIATNLVSVLKNYDCEIILINRRTSPFDLHSNCKANITEIIRDITEVKNWHELLIGIDFIFYFAAQTSIYQANENPTTDFKINVEPIFNLLETCRTKSIKPGIIFSSTVTVSDISNQLPISENDIDKPISFYDFHKIIAEQYLKFYGNNGYVNSVSLRISNVYGPGLNSKNIDRGILNLMVRKALDGEDITLYGDGLFLRDYIFINDVTNAFLLSAINIEKLNGKHFIVGTGKGHTIKDAFQIVRDSVENITGKIVKVISVPFPINISPVELRNFIADNSKLKKLTNWNPITNLRDGIELTINYYKNLVE
jgi:UDP-glucose 4-epimerase